MDSGNSGSMQSSSGGDEEYDSRSDSFSAFLNSSTHVVGPISNQQQQQPPQPHHHHHHHHPHNQTHQSTLYDPLSNYLDHHPFSHHATPPPPNPNSILNQNLIWPRTLRSEPNSTDITCLMASSSTTQSISASQDSTRIHLANPNPNPNPSSLRPSSSLPSDHQTNVVRNSKKRSRASRRAPTTVLTTDTSNFRAMVQEFTGIPAPPFSASPFPRTRFDLFNNASTTMRSANLEAAPPPFLLRPFAQKLHHVQSSTFGSSSSSPSFSSSTLNTSNPTTTPPSNNNNNNNYQLLSELGLPKQSQNPLNLQNPILSFQSLLQSSPPHPTTTTTTTTTTSTSTNNISSVGYPLSNVQIFNSKSQGSSSSASAIPSIDSHLKIGVLDEFGLNHGNVRTHLGGLPNLVTSDRLDPMPLTENNTSNWADGVGSNDGDRIQLRSFNGNSDHSQRVNSCKMNYTGPSSDFNAEKGPENVSSRGEGMVDSWICSSD